ncbi:hypothetical protein TL16_g03265 [Triparma laevis f. inornata]|uniref:Glycerate kinase n=1 Tax=Triparma laevis f. inornata TaxID=1714386 RepID=A0A9W7DYQ7_9STRA|nr:hypothetical protein TL16_g03265 [Triparma laevis f. inornata]
MNLRMSTVLPALFESLHPTLLPPIIPKITNTEIILETGYAPSQNRDVFTLSDYTSINIVGLGKASLSSLMPFATELTSLKNRGSDVPSNLNLLCVSKLDTSSPEHISALTNVNCKILYGDHPTPSEKSVTAARTVQTLTSSPSSLNLIFISGGTSSLCSLPSISLPLYKSITTKLVTSSHSIQSINSLRSLLDTFKSGGLSSSIPSSSTLKTYVISDVVDDDIRYIGSGPTMFQERDKERALEVWKTLKDECSESEVEEVEDVLKIQEDDYGIWEGYNEPIIISRNSDAVIQASSILKMSLPHLNVNADLDPFEGSADSVINKIIDSALKNGPGVYVKGGESTVEFDVNSGGKGGRNMEMTLIGAIKLNKMKLNNVSIACYGTDGNDGPTDAAGAMWWGGGVEGGRRVWGGMIVIFLGGEGEGGVDFYGGGDEFGGFSRCYC